MKPRYLAVILLVFGTAATADNSGPRRPHLHFSGGRTAQQRLSPNGQKLDAALAELTQQVSTAATQPTVAELHVLNPAAKFVQRASDPTPLVSIDAITHGDPQQLKQELVQLGLQLSSVYSNDVGGWLPVDKIDAATALGELHSIRAAMSRTRSGVVTSQGDFAQHSSSPRTTYSTLTGSGIMVGAISDSYNCYPVYAQNNEPASGPAGYASNGFTATATNDVGSGDLLNVNVVEEATCMDYGSHTQLPFGDERRAMLQLINEVA